MFSPPTTFRPFLQTVRDSWIFPMPLLTAVAFPLLAWGVIGLTFSQPIIQDVPVVVVDHSTSPLSRMLIRSLDATQVLQVTSVVSEEGPGTEAVRRGKATLAIVIPESFQEEVGGGSPSQVVVLANGAQLLYSKVAYRAAATTVTTLSAGVQLRRLRAAGMAEDEARVRAVPIQTSIQAPGNPWYDYGVYLIPSMAMAILQMSASFSALWMFREHGDRNTRLLLPPPGGRLDFLLSRGVPLLLANLVAVLLLFLVIFPLSGIPLVPALFPLFWRAFLFVVVCLGMGALLSLISRDLVFAAQVALVINAPAFVFSGFTYPRWAMPQAIQGVAALIPLTHFLDGAVPLLMFGANVWTGLPGLLAFLVLFWGGVLLLAGDGGNRLRMWQSEVAEWISSSSSPESTLGSDPRKTVTQ